jgi:hypothetical protein
MTTPTLSADRRQRIATAIAECDRYIAKESPRAADLRPADVADRLAYYIAHRAKLVAMLES